MITLIEAKNYGCLHYVCRSLDPFQVLAGPNASGKTTFLDVVSFLGDLVSKGPIAATDSRTGNFHDLLWRGTGDGFELAVEASIPKHMRSMLRDPECETIRYEIALQFDEKTRNILIRSEKVVLKTPASRPAVCQRSLFPADSAHPLTLLTPARAKGTTVVVNKVPNGNDNFYSETYREKGKGFAPSFKLGPHKSALANLPADEVNFPVTSWLKNLLTEKSVHLMPNIELIRQASPPGQGYNFKADGSNLPWVVDHLKNTDNADRFAQWLALLKTALPDLEDIYAVERPEDRFRYLVLAYAGGLCVPSWMASDGTLRLAALSILAYLPGFSGTYFIDEPENGLHPRAVDVLLQSLSSVRHAQIFLTTHSPVVLGLVETEKVLCFAKTEEGAVDIVKGDAYPALRDWREGADLNVLFAGGALG